MHLQALLVSPHSQKGTLVIFVRHNKVRGSVTFNSLGKTMEEPYLYINACFEKKNLSRLLLSLNKLILSHTLFSGEILL